MGLLDLVEHNDRVGVTADGFGKLSSLFVAHITRRSAYQTADGMAFHELGHIQLYQGIVASKQEGRQCFGQLSLTNARRAQKNKRANRAAGVFQARARPAHDPRTSA